MATPAEVRPDKLNDQWDMNFDLSDNAEPMLRVQGVPWLLRKLLGWISVRVAMQTWTDAPTGLTHFAIEYKPPLGLPSSREERVFNFEGEELTVPMLGKLRVRMRWAAADKLDEIDPFLAKGFDAGPNIHMKTEHLDIDAVTDQVFGFEEIGGTKYHARHIVVHRGGEVERTRLVYNYAGPR
ncbi:hypothetical protein C8A00DRAFT_39049 [Chaetomidium leptoderma]|uniref:Uncharacterized protein n=1 Tax=Chaetomidium leptoderma TaxID=669021 RepID=A0AAN6VBH8_9PEZI|nr:hypothetical protein C8A00DRAFT_39049 [Chaetomidium leptoderma]